MQFIPPTLVGLLQRLEAKRLQLAVLFFFIATGAYSQTAATTPDANSSQGSYPISLYQQATQLESHLYNGAEYLDYRKQNREGHQFFLQDQKALGQVQYDGALYDEVPLLYDLVTGEVITVLRGFLLQKLVSEKVSAFELHGHTFVRLVSPDSGSHSALSTGFYDLLYNGSTQLLAKRKKEKEYIIVDNKEVEKYKAEDQYFIKKENVYHQVKSSQSVYKLFQDQKKELKKFVRAQNLNFRKQREEAILALVAKYDALKK